LRGPIYAASVIANNFPDIDFAYATFLSKPLGYILHHRGHTHTLLALLPQVILILLGFFAYSRLRKQKWQQRDWGLLAFITCLGIFVHITLDSLNSYGVHPFWPWNNAWYSFDAVFIIEPAMWLALAPPLAFAAQAKWSKALFWGIFLGALGLVWGVDIVPLTMKIIYTLLAFGCVASATYFDPTQRIIIAICYCLIMTSSLVIISQAVGGSIRANAELENPEWTLEDVVRTPFPANPLCWNFFALGYTSTPNSEYLVKEGRYRLPIVPRDSSLCERDIYSDRNAQVKALPAYPGADLAGILWRNEFRRPAKELQALSRSSCHFGAFLQFARVPFWHMNEDRLYFGDLRYDRDPSKGFSEFEIAPQARCPGNLPGWKSQVQWLLQVTD
jgi:inner membrane protein